MTSDGKPYAPERFRGIVQEKYIIAKLANISYLDTSDMTPSERRYLLEFIKADLLRLQEALEKAKRRSRR